MKRTSMELVKVASIRFYLETERQSRTTLPLPLFYHFLSIGLEPNAGDNLRVNSGAVNAAGSLTGYVG